MSELQALSALDAAAGIRSGAFTALAVAEAALARTAALDPSINAFTLVTRERALTEAAAVDAARAVGAPLPPPARPCRRWRACPTR